MGIILFIIGIIVSRVSAVMHRDEKRRGHPGRNWIVLYACSAAIIIISLRMIGVPLLRF